MEKKKNSSKEKSSQKRDKNRLEESSEIPKDSKTDENQSEYGGIHSRDLRKNLGCG